MVPATVQRAGNIFTWIFSIGILMEERQEVKICTNSNSGYYFRCTQTLHFPTQRLLFFLLYRDWHSSREQCIFQKSFHEASQKARFMFSYQRRDTKSRDMDRNQELALNHPRKENHHLSWSCSQDQTGQSKSHLGWSDKPLQGLDLIFWARQGKQRDQTSQIGVSDPGEEGWGC